MVTNIGETTFQRCFNLKAVTCLNPTPPQIGQYTFHSYNATLYVPNGSKEAYQNAEGWKNFITILDTDEADAIRENRQDTKTNTSIFDMNGRKLSAPQKGLNIIRMSDGTTKKVIVR